MNPVSPDIMMLVSLTLCSGGLLFVRSKTVMASVQLRDSGTASTDIVFQIVMDTYLHREHLTRSRSASGCDSAASNRTTSDN